MRLLILKILRDLRAGPLAFGAASLMVAVAAMLFVAFYSADRNLQQSCAYTYEQLRFLDFYLPLRTTPDVCVDRVRGLPGVVGASGRRTASVRIETASHTVSGFIIGMPVNERPAVNDVHVEQGHYLDAWRGQLMLEKRFAEANGFQVGDRIQLRRDDNSRFSFTIVGLVSSPEFIWLANDRHDPRPAAHRLGIVFLSTQDARSVSGWDGINEIHVRVGNPRERATVMAAAARLLQGYTDAPAVPRELQPSNALLERDRRSFAAVAVLFPIVFIVLSAVILASALYQLVSQQRRQIGVLLSQGCSPLQVAVHYLAASLVVGLGGALVGSLCGHPLGEYCTHFYTGSLGIPFVVTRPQWGLMAAACGGATVVSLLAGAWAAFHYVHMTPARLMQMEFIAVRGAPPLERWFPPLQRASWWVRLALRNLMRQPVRSLVMVLGIAFAVTQLLMALAFRDSQEATVSFFFNQVHTYSLQVNLRLPNSPGALPPIEHWPGVVRLERYLREGAIITSAGRSLEKGIWGMPPGAELLRLYDSHRHRIEVASDLQLLLAPVYMRELAAAPGQEVQLQMATPDRRLRPITCAVGPALFEPIATPPKMALGRLQELASAAYHLPRDAVNILLIKVEPAYREEIRDMLSNNPLVRNVVDLDQMHDDVQHLLRMANAYFGLMFVFSGILAAALLVGSTTLNVMERLREIATMSILGVGDATQAFILLVETGVLWLVGLLLGIPTGYQLGSWLLNHYQADLLQMTLALRPLTILETAAGSLVLCALALLPSLRTILRMAPTTLATVTPG